MTQAASKNSARRIRLLVVGAVVLHLTALALPAIPVRHSFGAPHDALYGFDVFVELEGPVERMILEQPISRIVADPYPWAVMLAWQSYLLFWGAAGVVWVGSKGRSRLVGVVAMLPTAAVVAAALLVPQIKTTLHVEENLIYSNKLICMSPELPAFYFWLASLGLLAAVGLNMCIWGGAEN